MPRDVEWVPWFRLANILVGRKVYSPSQKGLWMFQLLGEGTDSPEPCAASTAPAPGMLLAMPAPACCTK